MADSHADPFGANDDDLEAQVLRYVKVRSEIAVQPADDSVQWQVRRIEGPPAVMTASIGGRAPFERLQSVIERVANVEAQLLDDWITLPDRVFPAGPFGR